MTPTCTISPTEILAQAATLRASCMQQMRELMNQTRGTSADDGPTAALVYQLAEVVMTLNKLELLEQRRAEDSE
jgi:hypothetical protein